MYVVFSINDSLDSDFFQHWLSSAEAKQRIQLAAQGSVRETVNFDSLGSILIPTPSIEKQKAISQALNESHREIELLCELQDKIAKQKRGLTQKLLTGNWLVHWHNKQLDRVGKFATKEVAR